MPRPRLSWIALALTGAGSALGYALLYAFDREIALLTTRTDGLYFLLPIAIAFAFSFVHGSFTGYFWQVLGVVPKLDQDD